MIVDLLSETLVVMALAFVVIRLITRMSWWLDASRSQREHVPIRFQRIHNRLPLELIPLGWTINDAYAMCLFGVAMFWHLGDSNTLNALWFSRWCILLGLLVLGFCTYNLRDRNPRIDRASQLTLGIFLLSALYSSAWFDRWSDQPFEFQSTMRQAVDQGALTVLICFLFIYFVFPKVKFSLMRMAALSCPITMAMVFIWKLTPDHEPNFIPLYANPSMTACYIAASYPLLEYAYAEFFRISVFRRYAYAALVLGSICATGTSSALVVFFITYLVCNWRSAFRTLLGAASVIAGGLLFSDQLRNKILGGSGRYNLWSNITDFWNRTDTYTMLFGTGPGTFRVLLPLIQLKNGQSPEHGPWFLWAHNDWLQAFVECGAVGFFFFVSFAGYLIWKLVKKKEHALLASTLGYIAMMCVNFPMHWPLHALLATILVGAAL